MFRRRSDKKEFLDNNFIPKRDLYKNLDELHIINKMLGGYRASINGLSAILKLNKNIKTIVDIGCGGGDAILKLAQFSHKVNQQLFFYGVDLKTDCILYAENNLAALPNKKLICDDYKNISRELLDKTDLIHCSLFLHHLSDDEIINLLKFSKSHNCILLANDLHRNWFAYYSIRLLSFWFSKSWLVQNDAPLSVLRGFRKCELIELLKKAGFSNYSVKWNWAFRYVITALE